MVSCTQLQRKQNPLGPTPVLIAFQRVLSGHGRWFSGQGFCSTSLSICIWVLTRMWKASHGHTCTCQPVLWRVRTGGSLAASGNTTEKIEHTLFWSPGAWAHTHTHTHYNKMVSPFIFFSLNNASCPCLELLVCVAFMTQAEHVQRYFHCPLYELDLACAEMFSPTISVLQADHQTRNSCDLWPFEH